LAKYKIYKIAKELNLASTTIIEFLSNMGHDLPKGHMSSINEELHGEVLKKFDRTLWLSLQEADKEEKVIEQKRESEKAREEELQKILADTSEISLGEQEIETEAAKQEIAEFKESEEPVEEITEEKVETKKEKPEEISALKKAKVSKPKEKKKEIIEEPKTPAVEEIAAPEAETTAPEPVKEKEKKKGKKKEDSPKTFAEMMIAAKKDDTIARARELARVREAEEQGLSPEEAHTPPTKKRRLKRKTDEDKAVKNAVERAQKAAIGRKRGTKATPVAGTPKQPSKKRRAKAKTEKPVQLPETGKKKKRRRSKRQKVDQKVVEATLKQTLASMDEKKPKKHRRKVQDVGEVLPDENILKVMEFVPTNELANLLDVPVSELIRKCLDMGLIVTINQRLDRDTIELLVEEYDYEIEFQSEFEDTAPGIEEEVEEEDKPEDLKSRPPIVTVMGHVDHGKTSLLDYLRKSNIIGGESGGITQHIGAYSIKYDDKPITFLDTPGHEAFTAMRARGTQVTDLVVLIVAADDHVMPQTLEAINHAKAAGVPIVVAINKIDKPTSDPDRIRRELSDHDMLVEEWGGQYQCALISAKTGDGIDNLLEEVVLAAEVLDLKANPERYARGTIIESRLDRGRGPLATVLVLKGTLKIGDTFVGGANSGRVKAMFDERGKKLKKIEPGYPVQLLGFDGTPQAGETLVATKSDKEAKSISLKRQALQREQTFRQIRALSLEGLSERIKKGESRELPLIIKADVNGSVEALSDSLMKLNTEEVAVNVIHRGVGAITETDVNLAAASSALIVGFMVHPNLKAKELAASEKVEIRVYRIIYDVINDVKAALEGMLTPDISEKNIGTLEVRQTFKVPKIGLIAGSYVQLGKIERNSKLRLVRDGQEIYEGDICSLRRFKDDVKEVTEGFECGVGITNFNDIKEGDVIEVYELIETKRTLE